MTTPARPVPALALAVLQALTLMLAVAEFGQAWYYPAAEAGAELTRTSGAGFRRALWVAAVAVILAHLLRHGPWVLLRALGPFLPFVVWGALVALLWSIDRTAGIRTLIFWALAAGVAVAAGSGLEPRTLARGVALLFLAAAAGSLALAVGLPEAATAVHGDGMVVRGLFPHKNAFGWFCALGLVWVAGLRGLLSRRLLALAALACAAGVAASGSKTALLVLAAVAAHALAAGLCRRLFPNGARAAAALIVAVAAMAAVAAAAAPPLLDAFGRDATLTGRTDVWRHYLAYLHDRPLTGYGTGILSSDSELNRALGAAVPGQESQGLRSPHSLYIGLASEAGLVGVLAFVLAQGTVALAGPFRRPSPWSRTAAALAVAILLAGIAEMRDGFMPGAATILLILARTVALRSAVRGSGVRRLAIRQRISFDLVAADRRRVAR